MDRTSDGRERRDRRRSEPVHIREVVAEIWAVFESYLPAASENLQDRPDEAADPARSGAGAELLPAVWAAENA